MYRATVCVDVDDVLLRGTSAAFERWFLLLGQHFDREVFNQTHNWELATGLSKRDTSRLYTLFVQSVYYPATVPVPGAQQAIAELCQNVSVVAVTARTNRIRRQTMDQLHHYFNGAIANGWFEAYGHKHRAVNKHGAFAHVDDSAHELRQIVEQTSDVWAIHFPSFEVPRRDSTHQRILTLKASHNLSADMNPTERDQLYRTAWREVTNIILDLCANPGKNRTYFVPLLAR